MLTGSLERMTFDGGPDLVPIWGPDNRLVFTSQRLGKFDPFITDGPGEEKLLYDMPERDGWPLDWSRDGRFLLWQGYSDPSNGNLWIIPVDTGQKPYLFIESMFDKRGAAFSPDGKWIAYSSNESGTAELYVKSFEGSTRYTVSAGGGLALAWRSDGKELFFQSKDGKLNVVSVTTQNSSLSFGKPQPMFAVPQASFNRRYEVSKDGQRILIPTGAAAITVILNWPELLRR